MSELETVEVQARDVLLRWIYIGDNETLAWQLKPCKKSIRYGIWRLQRVLKVPFQEKEERQLFTISPKMTSRQTLSKQRRNTNDGVLKERLMKAKLTEVIPFMRCRPNLVEKGSYCVGPNNGGHFALVFDNTFSKQTSKIVTYVLTAYPALPLQVLSSQNTSMHMVFDTDASSLHSGVLLKKKRKKLQGWARRYFTLNISTAILSYTGSPTCSILRGVIPLSISAISVNPKSKNINIDTGTEVWHLRVLSDKDWIDWCRAIEKAIKNFHNRRIEQQSILDADTVLSKSQYESLNQQLWMKVENLAEKIGFVKLEINKMIQECHENDMKNNLNNNENHYNMLKSENNEQNTNALLSLKHKNNLSSSTLDESTLGLKLSTFQIELINSELESISSQFKSILSEHHVLNQHLTYASTLKTPDISINSLNSKASIDTTFTREAWFDAQEIPENVTPYILISKEFEDGIVEESTTDEDEGKIVSCSRNVIRKLSRDKSMSWNKNKWSLYPLPYPTKVNRRDNIPPITVSPPSLLSFLRKNVGKDLSTITMPVIANEPLNLLQRAAEDLEYSELLNEAVSRPKKDGERILFIAAFAVSSFSSMRCKERLVRKPFSPLLGETFELVREDKGYRFLAEKVSHRPVVIACHAESSLWSYSHSPKPRQHFWGKSAELITDGSVLLKLITGDVYSYRKPTTFLRNVAFGEKYTEPVGHMTIVNVCSGEKAVVSFKQARLFSGRSEELSVQAFSETGTLQPLTLSGRWTHSLVLRRTDVNYKEEVIWSVGQLVDNPESHCGFTKFAATLNEITCIEDGFLPNTDTRLRKDQRNRENGNVDDAEKIKSFLEENQRQRRKKMESEGKEWKPRWFEQVKNKDPNWIIKTGDDSYWIQREKQNWTGIPKLW
ncbi:hypothetical protein PORY_002482 [Pneumocystis oryctolagi]|uniref:Uncharacterized protein n=1 Tax=Pneumocystis oryctolagi TaxID=42067 RepID=A0ACB7CB32_9ASCO|nr:hypothetical protein PORY_002482 [Pneumocystis oryctolagi]